MLTKIDHIGIAVRSIETARRFYEQVLGLVCAGEETIESQGVKVAFYALGDVLIELLEPLEPGSPVARFLEQKGEGIHHIAYASDDIAAQLEQARKAGARLIQHEPVAGARARDVAFLHPESGHGVLTEFCSKKL